MNAIPTLTTQDIADELRCTPRKVRKEAARLGLGVDLGGRAGYRYTRDELSSLLEALRPDVKPKRRRTARSP